MLKSKTSTVLNGLGIALISTSKGIMTDKEAISPSWWRSTCLRMVIGGNRYVTYR